MRSRLASARHTPARPLLPGWLLAVALLWALVGLATPAQAGQVAQEPRPPESAAPITEIELFLREGCPHCDEAKAFLAALALERPGLRVAQVDIRRDPAALARLNALSAQAGIAQPGVPTLRIGATLIVGFDTPASTGARIRAALDQQRLPLAAGSPGTQPSGPPPGSSRCGIDEVSSTANTASPLTCLGPPDETIALPFTGRQTSVADLGLPLFTVVIGLLDGFNPCSMWVLILMLSMLASLGDRRRMLAVAGTFVAIEGLAYFAFMAAWLKLFLFIGLSRASEIGIALLALVAGAINLKDFFAFGRGLSLSIPAATKPGIYARLRAILRAESLGPALVGTALLALLVQLVELLCTSGFPALYTRILTLRQLDGPSYYGYLLLYNLMYMLDDLVVLGIGVATLSQRRLQQHEGRLLKLVAGLVMVGLGIYLLVPRGA